MQRLRLCDHDQLRGGPGGHSESQWLYPGEQGAPGLIQIQLSETLDEAWQLVNSANLTGRENNI